MADQEELRQLKIKTGSVKRLTKELAMYEKEHAKEKERVGKMKADNADASDIKQAENVLSEAAMMVPDCRQRLETALADLVACVGEMDESVKPEDCEELSQANEVISAAEAIFSA